MFSVLWMIDGIQKLKTYHNILGIVNSELIIIMRMHHDCANTGFGCSILILTSHDRETKSISDTAQRYKDQVKE